MFKRLLIILFCSFFYLFAKAQTANQPYIPNNRILSTAILVSSETGNEPLVGATVRIVCKGDTLITATERMDGQVPLAICFYTKTPSDSVELIVSYVGYKTFKRKYPASKFKGIKK